MDTPRPYGGAAARIGLFAAGLVVVFAVAAGIGSLLEPAETEGDAGHGGGGHGGEPAEARAAGPGAAAPAGLAVAAGGYSLRLEPAFFARGETERLRFAIAGPGGEPVAEFDSLHERRMHLIVVRRDGRGFQHLHPAMGSAGTWSVPIAIDEPGAYRAFADFSVGGEQHTLATDLFVSGGEFEAQPFPAPAAVASTDGYEVRLHSAGASAGEPASLAFTVSRDGREANDLAPYLGAKGHLVALREGDLAYLHVHPEGAEGGHGDGAATGGEIAFAATFPSAGRYRLYLQFRHEGAVRTAELTVEVPR